MKNIGSEPFDCQALLHTYLQAEAIENVRIGGFENVPFIEKVGEKSNHGPREAEHIALKTIPYEVDRIYTPSIARNPNDEDKTVVVDMLEGSRKVVVSSCASKTVGGVVQSIVPDCVLWNLWVDKAMAMGDMQDDAYLKYVCIEPGLVEKPHTVAPGDVLTLTQTLTK
jgi:glucose-6-phosphate 1-epimerase